MRSNETNNFRDKGQVRDSYRGKYWGERQKNHKLEKF